MKDVGSVQKKVWERIHEAIRLDDGEALRIYGEIAADMDRKHDEWTRLFERGNGANGNGQVGPNGKPPIPSRSPTTSSAGSYEDFSGRPIYAVELAGERVSVGSYKELLLTVIGKLQKLHPDNFDSIARQVRGRGPYFSENGGDLRVGHKLHGSRLSVETNLNASLIVEICRRLVDAFGIDSTSFKIEASPTRTRALKRS